MTLILLTTLVMKAQERPLLIEGKITTTNNEPVANALVTVKNTFIESETGPNGVFRLPALASDELVVTAFLMETKTVAIPEPNTFMNIQVDYNAEVLEAVILEEKEKKKSEEIDTGMGKRKSDAMGYSADTDMHRFISVADVDMYQVARKMPFLNVVGPLNNPVVFTNRMSGMLSTSRVPIQVIVDGIPVEQNVLATINPNFVTDITVLRSLAGTVKYGSIGAGGVMLITTTNSGSGSKNNKALPSLLVQGNDYAEEVLPISENIAVATSEYLTALTPYDDVNDALAVYNKQRQQLETRNLGYYIDVARYFSRWGDAYRYMILGDLYEQANSNPRILKTIIYILEEEENFLQAAYVQEKLLELEPDHIQNYRDLALLYTKIGKYNLAATLYKQMISNTIPNVDFNPIKSIVVDEFRHLIANHKRNIVYKDIPNELLSLNFKKDIRIVIEYSNPMSEFDVQFVSPNKKYYTWSHNYFDSKDVIEEEIAEGYNMKEFLIEDSDRGGWLINIQKKDANTGANPTFLKYTLYRNFGLPNEEKTVKVLNLARHTQKVTLDTFIY